MNNCERFNAMLNGCRHSRAIYAALLALGSHGGMNEPLEQHKSKWRATRLDSVSLTAFEAIKQDIEQDGMGGVYG